MQNIPLNQIFYGPPGTGKTYRTTKTALEIIDPVSDVQNSDRPTLKKRFAKLQEEGQIGFITFHQSLGYEEFVEGIRPVIGDEQEEAVSYEMAVGIFKKIANKADENREASQQKAGVPDTNRLFDEFADDLEKRIEEDKEEILLFGGKYAQYGNLNAKITKINRNSGGDPRSVVVHPFRVMGFDVLRRDYPKLRKGEISDAKDIRPSRKSERAWHGNASCIYGLLHHIKDYEEKLRESVESKKTPLKNYVLVIDEINRGNISRIFGELITLIEESKRLGNEDATLVELPHSGDFFGVPKNLHIIGTMNTADRSIALLDTALRRRFRFVEMMPELKLLNGVIVDDIDIKKLLASMNARIEALYDRDHQIGHSYFLRLKKQPNIETLSDIFQFEVLPLLQEYFYDDWEKIDLVLNKNGFLSQKNPPKMSGDAVVEDRKIWSIDNTGKLRNPANYQKIYANVADTDTA